MGQQCLNLTPFPDTADHPKNELYCLRWLNPVRGHEKVLGYGHLRSPLVATKVPAFGHEKSPPLTEVST